MHHEIEIKLAYVNKGQICSKLIAMGAELKEKYSLHDTYFSLNHKDMSNTHDLLRVRKKDDLSELTFKGKCETEGAIWKRVELTTSLGNADNMIEILGNLKFNKLSENKSDREIWNLGDIEIAFIDFSYPEKINLIEIEGNSEEEVDALVRELGDLVKKMGEEDFKKFDDSRKK